MTKDKGSEMLMKASADVVLKVMKEHRRDGDFFDQVVNSMCRARLAQLGVDVPQTDD